MQNCDWNNPAFILPMPIKVVDNKWHHLRNQMKIIDGPVTAENVRASSTVIASPVIYDKKTRRATQSNITWYVLLDSGSDGDIYFCHPSKDKLNVPLRKRLTPITWKTSKGSFSTEKVARICMTFPEFNASKRIFAQPDVVDLLATDALPTFDIILGVKTMAAIKASLDFEGQTICIDGARLTMQQLFTITCTKPHTCRSGALKERYGNGRLY